MIHVQIDDNPERLVPAQTAVEGAPCHADPGDGTTNFARAADDGGLLLCRNDAPAAAKAP